MEHEARFDLLQAYARYRSLPRKPGAMFSSVNQTLSEEEARIALNKSIVSISKDQVERYQEHGLAKIVTPISYNTLEFIIDIEPLREIAAPTKAWVSSQEPEKITIILATKKQKAPQRAIKLDLTRDLQGLMVTLQSRSRTHVPAPYDYNLTPLYLK